MYHIHAFSTFDFFFLVTYVLVRLLDFSLSLFFGGWGGGGGFKTGFLCVLLAVLELTL
jgi:hypothetical protein